MPITQTQYNNVLTQCNKTWDTVFGGNGGNIVYVPDGTIYVEINTGDGSTTPYQITQTCCNVLKNRLINESPTQYPINVNPNDIFFDLDEQKCRWSETPASACSLSDTPIKIVLNPVGNDGVLFTLNENDTCRLEIKFDYLFKINCSTLGDIVTPDSKNQFTTSVNNDYVILNQIKFEKESQLFEINNQLESLSKIASNTPYSIVCDNFPLNQEFDNTNKITQKQTLPFLNTGFESVTKTSIISGSLEEPIYKTRTVNFCLTETGLNTWKNIIGENNYIDFINGNQNSYTCSNVIEIDKLNQEAILNNEEKLIYECNTPFGEKTKLLNEITSLALIQKNLKLEIENFESQLIVLNETTSPCTSILGQFENINASVTLDLINEDNETIPNVFVENFFNINQGLYNYLVSNQNNSGFFVCGEPNQNETWTTNCTGLVYPEFTFGETIQDSDELNVSICQNIKDIIYQNLYDSSGAQSQEDFNQSLSPNIFNSNWLTYSKVIEVPSIFYNNKIKMNILINDFCENFCILIDQINMTKICDDINRTNVFISQSPGFNLTRVVDNKKSWVEENTYTERKFYIGDYNDDNKIRQTNYNLDEERLILNSKEIDLTINMASAVENDVWCYILDNTNLLTGTTNTSPCIQNCGDSSLNISGLTSTNFNELDSLETFEETLLSELIDVKNRKVLSSYPTLRAIYDRYMNSTFYGLPLSNQFTYEKMDEFSNLVKTYWNDIIEQVVPATTLWGNVKIYTNTMFDQQKFKYKSYTTLLGQNNFEGENIPSPINSLSGQCESVDVLSVLIPVSKDNLQYKIRPVRYNSLCIAQMNTGSEFIGKVEIISE
jgi:hypothetical protein